MTVPRITGATERRNSSRFGMKPNKVAGGVRTFSFSGLVKAIDSTSEMPNRPIASGTRSMPPSR